MHNKTYCPKKEIPTREKTYDLDIICGLDDSFCPKKFYLLQNSELVEIPERAFSYLHNFMKMSYSEDKKDIEHKDFAVSNITSTGT